MNHDFMSYAAPLAPGQSGTRPTAGALGLTRAMYANRGWYSGAANTGQVDVAGAKLIASCQSASTPMLMDIEPWLQEMQTTVAGQVFPADLAKRTTFGTAIASAVNAMRSTANGATRIMMPYASVNGQYNPYNPPAWQASFKATNEAMFLEPYPGAPNGIQALFDYVLVSCYTSYEDQALNDLRIDGLLNEAQRLFPGKPLVGLLHPRWGQTNPTLHFDFMPEARFEHECRHVRSRCQHSGLWDSNLYGPPGAARNPATGYALAGGNAWDSNAGWWKAYKRTFIPQTATMPHNHGGGVSSGLGGVR